MRYPAHLSQITTALLLGTALPAAARAQSTGLEDMVGARAGQGEMELQRRGYVNIRGEQGDDRAYTYWWNADRRQCVSIATMEGRYNSIQPTTSPDCRKPANLRPGHGPTMTPIQHMDARQRPPVAARPAIHRVGRSSMEGTWSWGSSVLATGRKPVSPAVRHGIGTMIVIAMSPAIIPKPDGRSSMPRSRSRLGQGVDVFGYPSR